MNRSLLLALLAAFAVSAPAQTKRTLKPDEYKQWETVVAPAISNDGRWVSYVVSLVDGDPRLIVRNSDTPQLKTYPAAGAAQFSDDSKWSAFLISPPKAVADKMREEKKPVQTKLGLLNLEAGQEQIFDDVQSFRFLKGSRYLLAHRYRGPGKTEGGSDLLVVDLATGESLTVGNVTAMLPNEAETRVALVVESDSGHRGVQLLDPATNSIRTLFWGREAIRNASWAEKADRLAFLTGRPDEKKDGDSHRLVLVTDASSAKPKTITLDPSKREGFPSGYRISEASSVQLNETGTAVAFGIQEWTDKRRPQGKPEDRAGVEVWNSRDWRVMPQQKVQAPFDRRRGDLCVWHLEGDLLRRITDGEGQAVYLLKDFNRAVVTDSRSYRNPVTIGVTARDISVVDTRTGNRTQVLTKATTNAFPSPEGKYLTYFTDGDWWLYDVTAGQARNVTKGLPVSFKSERYDGTSPVHPPAAGPTWMAEDMAVVLADDYDSWLVRPGQPAFRLTNGRAEKTSYRLLDLEDD